MAIALVKSAKGTSAVATVSPSFGSSPTSGNLIVLSFASDDYNGTPDTGWTQSTGMEQQTFHGAYIWWRISNGSNPPGSYTIGSATNSAWVMAEFSGADAAPYDISNGTFTQSNTGPTSQSTPSIVPTTGNRVLCAMVGASNTIDLSVYSVTWGSSFTAVDATGTNGAGTNDGCALSYRLVTGDSSTSFSTSGSIGQGSQSRSGLIIAFKELAGGGGSVVMFADQARS